MEVDRKVYVLYTGGTFGMKPGPDGKLAPQPLETIKDFLISHTILYEKKPGETEEECRKRIFHGIPDGWIPLYHQLAEDVPQAKGKQHNVLYKMEALDKPIDSSCITPHDWYTMADKIQIQQEDNDAFVIIHGTDTMAFTSSALSFILRNLKKTVIVTGAQTPIFYPRTDGLDNFIGTMLMAAYFSDRPLLKTVLLYDLNKLYKGNRVVKTDCDSFSVFDSPNEYHLASLETTIKLYECKRVDQEPPRILQKRCNVTLADTEVRVLRFFPGITKSYVSDVLEGASGLILESFGSGNVPDFDWLEDLLMEADRKGVLMLNCTQVYRGTVLPIYETSSILTKANVIPGYDITPEAALTKMIWVLKEGFDDEEKRMLLSNNVCGESCAPPHPRPVFATSPEDVKK